MNKQMDYLLDEYGPKNERERKLMSKMNEGPGDEWIDLVLLIWFGIGLICYKFEFIELLCWIYYKLWFGFDWYFRLLYVKLLNRYAVDGYNYCAAEGCQLVRIEVIP